MSAPPPYTEQAHQQPTQTFTVITHQPTQNVIVHSIQLGPGPTFMNCPNCLAPVTTIVDYKISGRTHLCALGLCLIGLWPCMLIPYFCCGGCCQKTVHSCPNCRHFVGTF